MPRPTRPAPAPVMPRPTRPAPAPVVVTAPGGTVIGRSSGFGIGLRGGRYFPSGTYPRRGSARVPDGPLPGLRVDLRYLVHRRPCLPPPRLRILHTLGDVIPLLAQLPQGARDLLPPGRAQCGQPPDVHLLVVRPRQQIREDASRDERQLIVLKRRVGDNGEGARVRATMNTHAEVCLPCRTPGRSRAAGVIYVTMTSLTVASTPAPSNIFHPYGLTPTGSMPAHTALSMQTSWPRSSQDWTTTKPSRP
jgi:hypothetical protein